MADLSAVFSPVCEMFGIRELNAYQREAIVQFVQKKTDVFVNLPTGYGKSLIYQALPFVYDSILEAAGHIIVYVRLMIAHFFLRLIILGSRGYFFLIDTDGWQRSCVNEEKNNLWSQEYATSFPCEKSVQNLNWVTDWILPCPQGINNIIMALIGYIEQVDMGVSNR